MFRATAQNNFALLKKAFSNKDSSDYYFGQAKKAIKTATDEADYYLCKNAFCTDYGKEDSAILYGKVALQKFYKLKDTVKPLYVYNNLAKVYQKKGQYQKAIVQLFEGLKFAQSTKNMKWIGWLLQNISLNYHDFGNYHKGVYYGKQAYHILKKDTADVMSTILALNAIAINFDDWNKPDSALSYHQQSLSFKDKVPENSIGFVYNNIGNTLVKLKKFVAAAPYVNKAVDIAESKIKLNSNAVNVYELATSYTNLARIYYESKNYEKAIIAFEKADYYVVNSHSVEKMRDFYQLGFWINKVIGDYKKALNYSEKYNALRDSIFKKENAKTIADIEAQYRVAEKDKLLLEEKVTSARKSMWIFGLTALVLGILAIAYLLYKQQRLKNVQQKQEFKLQTALTEVETKNKLHEQRLSISRDLHDNIGAQLTFIISCVDTLKYGNNISDASIAKQLVQISDFAKNTITELRDTLWALNSDIFTLEDLRLRTFDFMEKAKLATNNLQFNFGISPTLAKLSFSSSKGINIYRAMQEAVNNAIKHSGSNLISVEISESEDQLRVEVKDNGVGFVKENADGNGIFNMHKRISEVNGSCLIETGKGQGTRVVFLIPKSD
ncbi:ATP-binding protein [Pedobacter sp.]